MRSSLAILLLLMLPFVSSQLSYFPNQFIDDGEFSGTIVVGAEGTSSDVLAAADIAAYLQSKATDDTIEKGDTKLDIQITSTSGNLIIVGTPCGNTKIMELLDLSGSCQDVLPVGTGFVLLKEQDGTAHLFVMGDTSANVAKAATVLAKKEDYRLGEYFLSVTGNTEPYTVKWHSEREMEELLNTPVDSEENTEDTPAERQDVAEHPSSSTVSSKSSGNSQASESASDTENAPHEVEVAIKMEPLQDPESIPPESAATHSDNDQERPPATERKSNAIVRLFRWFGCVFTPAC